MTLNFNAGVGNVDEYGALVTRRGRVLYSDATVTPTEAIDSGDLDLSAVSEIVIVVKNGNTTLTRAPQLIFKNDAGTEIHRIVPTAIAANTTVTYVIANGATATGVTAGYAFTPSPKFQLTAAAPASGTGDGYVQIWGR